MKINNPDLLNNNKIKVIRIGYKEYISLTDLARYADEDEPRYPIQNWMRNKDVVAYLGLWEKLNNKDFKGVEFDAFKNEAGSNKFKRSPQKWIKETNAIGIISKSGNNGGTYAVKRYSSDLNKEKRPTILLVVFDRKAFSFVLDLDDL